MTTTPDPHPFCLIAAGELEAWIAALPWIASEYLPELRARLRDDRRWPQLSGNVREERARVLDAVCRRLVAELEGYSAEYLVGVGDMFPTVPDTIEDIA